MKLDRIARRDYADAHARFSIEDEIASLAGDLDAGLNAAVECCDRHCGRDLVALRTVSAEGNLAEYTFEDLRALSARSANVLKAHGVGPGDVVAGLLPRTLDLIATILGVWRLGAVYQPLFTAFGPKAIEHRLTCAGTRMIVTTAAQRGKLDEISDCPPVALIRDADTPLPAGDIDLCAERATAATEFAPVLRDKDAPFMVMSTSGTTGLPKALMVPQRAMLAFAVYMRDGIGLHEDDTFWNLADAGWAYGLYYAVCGPLLLGAATTLHEGGFSAETTIRLIDELGITSLAGSPTAFRMLIAAGPEAVAPIKGKLRTVSSAGEPLNPEIIHWFEKHLSVAIHDHYGQTELGMCVNNHHGLEHDVRPGSAGYAMPGYRIAVLDEAGNEQPPNSPGELAVDIANSPLLWFTGYYGTETPAIAGGYYRTGDSVEIEPDGSLSFIGRADDVITSSGYRIGPFDVESALIEHPAVIEAAVVGIPDPERTELVKAFVILGKGHEASDALCEELQQHVKKRLSAHAYPRLIDFVDSLPKTPSGKIQRFLLRKAEVEKQNVR